MAATVERDIKASCQQVFDVLSDGWLYSSWVVGTSRIRDVDASWPSAGAKLHHSFGVWPLVIDDESEVLRCERPHRLTLRAKGWPAGEATVDLTLTQTTAGCHATMVEDATAGPGTLVPAPLRAPVLAARNRESLLRLALIAEHGAR